MRRIGESELILNPDGSIYHLHLKPEHIAKNIIFVGDQNRVQKISKYFDSITFETQNREFTTVTGHYKGVQISVISTGIGTDNIDIVMNELDALVNIDLTTRTSKKTHTSLNIVRIGTSGSLQNDIPLDSFVLSKYGLGLDGMLHSYDCESILETDMENAFIAHSNWNSRMARPYIVKNSSSLENKFKGKRVITGITATAGGFYAPQGRKLRLPPQYPNLNDKISSFSYKNLRITNLEMETSAIYGLARLLGHNACSLSAIIANRPNKAFTKSLDKTLDDLILYTLNRFTL